MAGPFSHAFTNFNVGEWLLLVKYSVINPINIPDHRPQTIQPKAYILLTTNILSLFPN